MAKSVVKCGRCGRRMRSMEGWNMVWSQGVPVGHLCPDCQTPEENAEAEINEATIDYKRSRLDAEGRLRAPLNQGEG